MTLSLVWFMELTAKNFKIRQMQNDIAMKMTPNERIEIAGKMFMANREMILNSLPKDLSEEEKIRHLYFRTYGEHLPEDFFNKTQEFD